MLEPMRKEITTQAGVTKAFYLSKFPAIAGREIIAKYPFSNAPKLGDYVVSEETMLKLMAFVAVETDSGQLALSTRALIDNHVPDWETLMKLEFFMLDYNCSFFRAGLNFDFLKSFGPKLQAWLSPILTDLSAQLLKADKQPSTS